jgi:acyl-CoA thioester hydrolase
VSDSHYAFELELEVRDYECDLQGVVNNAVYQNYLEHARHQYLRGLGLDFAGLHERGYDLVLTRCEIDYKRPLRSGDRFAVRLCLEQASRLRFLFVQDIFKLPSGEHVLHGRFTGTCLGKGGRPCFPPEFQAALHRPAPPDPNQG